MILTNNLLFGKRRFECVSLISITEMPVNGLTWITTNNMDGVPQCIDAGWVISPDNLSIRYNVSDSANCGGTCDLTQSGSASATITVGSFDTYLNIDFNGIGELESSAFDVIAFHLDGVEVSNGHAAGGGLTCSVGPIIETVLVPGPYYLLAGSVHILLIDFSTNDPLYHTNSYYQVNLSFA